MKTICVEVDEGCIRAGVRESCENCPVALGLVPHVADGVTVSVGEDKIVFYEQFVERSHCLVTPSAVVQFIEDFDNKEPVSPFSFEMNVPDSVLA